MPETFATSTTVARSKPMNARLIAATNAAATNEELERSIVRHVMRDGRSEVVGFILGSLVGLWTAQFALTVFAASSAAAMWWLWTTVVLVAAMIALPVSVSLAAWRVRRRLDAERWRPRLGARHPRGRDDTYDRLMIERSVIGGGARVALIRWYYREHWDWEEVESRTFLLEELDEAERYAGRLEQLATSDSTLIERWADSRARQFIGSAHQ